MNGTTNELKQALLKCANENENKAYLTGQIIISSICKDAKDTIERLEKENEQLKQLVSYLEDNLRVARKDREDLRDSIANGLEEFLKEKPHTSLRLLANKKSKEENERLKSQVEKMIQDVSDMKYFTSFGMVSQACTELLTKWGLSE